MKEKEFNLSEKIRRLKRQYQRGHSIGNIWRNLEEIHKEFVKLLDKWKDIMRTWHIKLPTIELLCSEFDRFKKELAGQKLIEKEKQK